jgi:hypothetical protein
MRKCIVIVSLVLALVGTAYGMKQREEVREYYPRDRVVEREVIREKPVYVKEKPHHKKWWKWRNEERREERREEREEHEEHEHEHGR